MSVAEESRKYFVIATHKGYFRYTRLPFGVNFAPSLFQSTMDKVLAGVDSTAAYIDDIISGADTVDRHLSVLRAVFDCLRKAGVKIQLNKCKFLQSAVTYLGHRIDAEGIHPTDERLRAFRDIPTPTNQKQLRSFLGAINYYSKFVPQLQTKCAPLHRLTRLNTKWIWNPEHEKTFQGLKHLLTSSETLVHYDENKPLILATDASDIGVGAVLLHRFPDNTERPIAYASRVLSDTERRYAVIDKEALAIVFAVNKFQQYILGRRFTLKTDHKPLERLFGPKSEIPKLAANRISRWALTLSMFDFDIQYQAGINNAPADVLSRLPVPVDWAETSISERMGESSQLLHLKLQDMASISKKEIRQKTASDSILSQVFVYIERGWPTSNASLPMHLHTFFEKRTELSMEEEMLLWKGRIVIPTSLRQTVLNLLHEGHPGISAMRDLAKFYVWWPKIDDDIEHYVATCKPCQQTRPKEPEVPLFSWNVPTEPWARIHIDFAGPFENNMWLIVVDAYTKWLEIIRMKSTTAAPTCAKLREIFARFGVPRVIVSDNGPQFVSEEFKAFCKMNLIQHITSTPYHAKTNGLAERAVRTFKERMLAAKSTVPDINTRLQKFLLCYRNTPQKSTGRPPSELLLGHRLRTCFDLIKPDVRARIELGNYKQQLDHDKNARLRFFAAGDPVWVADNTGSGHHQGKVVRRTGPLSYLILLMESGRQVRKHADQLRFRRLATATHNDDIIIDAEIDADADDEHQPQFLQPAVPAVPPTIPIVPPEVSNGQSLDLPAAPVASSTPTAPATAAAPEPSALAAPSVPNAVLAPAVPVQQQQLRRSQRARKFPSRPYDKYL